jgi:hypothetical protein
MRVHFLTDDPPPRDREQFFLDFVAKHVMRLSFNDGIVAGRPRVRRLGEDDLSGRAHHLGPVASNRRQAVKR